MLFKLRLKKSRGLFLRESGLLEDWAACLWPANQSFLSSCPWQPRHLQEAAKLPEAVLK